MVVWRLHNIFAFYGNRGDNIERCLVNKQCELSSFVVTSHDVSLVVGTFCFLFLLSFELLQGLKLFKLVAFDSFIYAIGG